MIIMIFFWIITSGDNKFAEQPAMSNIRLILH